MQFCYNLKLLFLRTNGTKIFDAEIFKKGFWLVFNFLPGKMGIYIELNFNP